MYVGSPVRGVIFWALIMLILSIGYKFRHELQYNRVMAHIFPDKGFYSDRKMYFYKADDGHFYITAKINGHNVKFLFDTGASDIALTQQDAKRVGINIYGLSYNRAYNTANGVIMSAPVRLSNLQIGEFVLPDVRANISNAYMDISLLGMSALERFHLSLDGNKLILSTPSYVR